MNITAPVSALPFPSTSPLLAFVALPDAPTSAGNGRGEQSEQDARDAKRKQKRRRAKLRSVWISFVGRILAQFVGSTASIVLGLLLANRYHAAGDKTQPVAVEHVQAERQGHVAPAAHTGASRRRTIAISPLDEFSSGTARDGFARSFTALLVARLVDRADVSVDALPSLAAADGTSSAASREAQGFNPDFVLTGSVVRTSTRTRIIAQVVDARTGEPLWAKRYEPTAGDVIDIQDHVADDMANALHEFFATGAAAAPGPRLTALNDRSAQPSVEASPRLVPLS